VSGSPIIQDRKIIRAVTHGCFYSSGRFFDLTAHIFEKSKKRVVNYIKVRYAYHRMGENYGIHSIMFIRCAG